MNGSIIGRESELVGAGLLALLALLMISVAAFAAPPPSDTRPWTQRVRTEEQRQNQVARRVDNVSRRFRALINDLQSNGFIEESRGNELLTAIEVLNKVNDENVRQAIISLGEARKKPAAAMTHLTKADTEIEIVVDDLIKLLQLARATEAGQLLREELHRVIRQEEAVWEKTKQLGRDQLVGNQILPAEVVNLASAQVEVARLAGKLRAMFPLAVEDAVTKADRNRIGKAMDLYTEREVDMLLTDAAQNVEEMSLVKAAVQQEEAISVLRQVEQMLAGGQNGDARNLGHILATLRQLLEDQRELRIQTEAAEPPKFTTVRRQLQGRQRELRNVLAKIDASLFDPGKIGGGAAGSTNPIKDADLAMEQAETALEAINQKEAGENQRKAEEHLERAIAAFELGIEAADKRIDPTDPIAAMNKLAILLGELLEQQIKLREATQQQAAATQDVAPQAAPQQELMDRTLPVVEIPEAQLVAIQKGLGMALTGMETAVATLKENKPAEAVPAQKEAEAGLAAALRAAETELAAMKKAEAEAAALHRAQKAIEKIIKEQNEIANQTEEAKTPAEIKQPSEEQSQLAEKTRQTAQAAPPEVQPDLQEAAKAMKDAAEAMEKGNKEKAQDAQQKATKALKSAAQKAAEAKSSKSKGGKGKGKAKGKGKGGKGKGKGGKGKGKGKGEGKEGKGGGKGGKGKGKPSRENIDSRATERAFAKGSVSGTRPDDTNSAWKTLGEREQDVVSQRYIQQLPVEYRELLRDYYQTLSKEEKE